MKSKWSFILLLLTGCGGGFSVEDFREACSCHCEGARKYRCVQSSSNPIARSHTVAICDTQDECNKICLEKRK